VFELLSTIQQSHVPLELHRCSNEEREAMADFNAKQSKSAKIEEWKSMPLVSVEQLQKWWQTRIQRTAWKGAQEVAPALVHFSELSVHARQDPPADQIVEPLPTYDSAPIWQPLATGPNRPQYALPENASPERGLMRGSFDGALYPVDNEMLTLSPDRSTSTPKPPESGSLSESQWRKYF
jgi:hypothetical protein